MHYTTSSLHSKLWRAHLRRHGPGHCSPRPRWGLLHVPLVHLRHVPLLGPWTPAVTSWQAASHSACAALMLGRPPPGAVIAAGLCTLHSAHVRLRHMKCMQGCGKADQAACLRITEREQSRLLHPTQRLQPQHANHKHFRCGVDE